MVVFNNVIHSIRHLAFQVSILLLQYRLSSTCQFALLILRGCVKTMISIASTSYILLAV